MMRSFLISSAFFTISLRLSTGGYCRSNEETCPKNGDDPRSAYDVDADHFISVNDDDDDEGVTDDIVEIVTKGDGYFMLRNMFTEKDIDHARETILYLIAKQGSKATHFQGTKDASLELQARVWNLLAKGRIFEKFVQHPRILKIARKILGDDVQLGSIASNTIFPGGSGQEPHIDYPYWDYYSRDHWPAAPKHKDVPFFMNFQATILLDAFTPENGATAFIPGSQREAHYPTDKEAFLASSVRAIGNPGDVMVFVGLLQHCAMPNLSQAPRSAILLQYLPKYIRPMEDMKRSVGPVVKRRASQDLRRLLLLDYPYPAILDESEALNSEGAESEFDWK